MVGVANDVMYTYRMATHEAHRRFSIPRDAFADFCRRHHIRKLSLFGSVLRDDFRSDSDVDVLVEFEPSKAPGLNFFQMQRELSALFNRPVDLHTRASLSRYFRDEVMAEAQVQYAAS
jgi:uncharacterized protein